MAEFGVAIGAIATGITGISTSTTTTTLTETITSTAITSLIGQDRVAGRAIAGSIVPSIEVTHLTATDALLTALGEILAAERAIEVVQEPAQVTGLLSFLVAAQACGLEAELELEQIAQVVALVQIVQVAEQARDRAAELELAGQGHRHVLPLARAVEAALIE